MKRQTILLLLSVLLLSGGAAAQSTKEQTLEDLNRTAALYYCYENHPRAAATPAPEGYEPFYISHYGRHGSDVLLLPRNLFDGGRPPVPHPRPFDARAALHAQHGRRKRTAQRAESRDRHYARSEQTLPRLHVPHDRGEQDQEGDQTAHRRTARARNRPLAFRPRARDRPLARRQPQGAAPLHERPLLRRLGDAGCRLPRLLVLRPLHARRALRLLRCATATT